MNDRNGIRQISHREQATTAALRAVLKGGMCDTLIADEQAARAILAP